MRPILNELPETLDATYGRILQEIPKSNRLHAHRLLQCLTVAVRPLRVEELAEVLAVDFDATGGIPKLTEDLRWEDQEQAILLACSSLIAVAKEGSSRVVQFSHFSVKEFLTSDRLATSTIEASRYHHILFEPSHVIMAQACLSVLLRLDSNINLEDFPLARYACLYFGDHAEFGNVFARIRDGIDYLLDSDKPHFAAWLWVREDDFRKPLKRPEATPLYHVSGFGFRAMVDHLIPKRPGDLIVRGHYGTPLHAALCSGHNDVSLLLLRHCVDVDVRGIDDRTPLHMAVDSGLLEATRILVERGASINARDSKDRTPLYPTCDDMSCTFDDTYFEVVRYLLDHGADVDAQANTKHSTPLHLASYYGGFKVARLLLNRGVDIDVQDTKGRTPLHEVLTDLDNSISDYFVDAKGFLLDHGADPDAKDSNGSTPLHVISRYGNVKAARVLLDHGACVDALDDGHVSPLHFASRYGHAEIARLLLEHALTKGSQTLQHLLTMGSEGLDIDTIQFFLEHGADVDTVDNNHSTLLHKALYNGNTEVARLLLEHGANINARNNEGQTPRHLLLAMDSEDLDVDTIRFFLLRGADVDAVDNNHSTLLHKATYNGNTEVARLLFEYGANINARNKDGQTPQHLLAMFSEDLDVDTIRLFLEHGADVNVVDNNQSMLHKASYYGNIKVARLLLEHGGNINAQDKSGDTPLHQVLMGLTDNAGAHFFDTIQLLLEHGADVDALDDAQSTPLHVASENGSAKATRLLLKHGANVHLKNDEGHTPSQVASANGHEELAELLSEPSQNEQKM